MRDPQDYTVDTHYLDIGYLVIFLYGSEDVEITGVD